VKQPLRHVLIIDDDDLMRRAWARYFKAHEWDWEVETVATMNDFVVALGAPGKVYDLFVSDFDLCDPEGDGVNVLRMAWINRPMAFRIMCSGHSSTHSRIKPAIKDGTVESFICKPFSTAVIDHVLKEEFAKTEQTG